MKNIILATFCIYLVGVTCHASGKLSLTNNFYDVGGNTVYRPGLGVTVYEKLMKHLASNSFVGVGNQYLESSDDVTWVVAKTQLDYSYGSFIYSPGILYKQLPGMDIEQLIVYAKVDWVLW